MRLWHKCLTSLLTVSFWIWLQLPVVACEFRNTLKKKNTTLIGRFSEERPSLFSFFFSSTLEGITLVQAYCSFTPFELVCFFTTSLALQEADFKSWSFFFFLCSWFITFMIRSAGERCIDEKKAHLVGQQKDEPQLKLWEKKQNKKQT